MTGEPKLPESVGENESDKREDRRVHRLAVHGAGLALAFGAVAIGEWWIAGGIVGACLVVALWAMRR